MRRAMDYPIAIVNDIRGGTDVSTLEKLARRGCVYLAMHMLRDPQTMQSQPLDAPDALEQVERFYASTFEKLREIGFDSEKIWLDPGIGFGKTDRANLQLIRQALEKSQEFNLVLGISRKSFLGRLLDIPEPEDRDGPSKMLELSFLMNGIKAVRTHDVRRLKRLRDLL
jgi:dihydropteroate synthase